MKIKRIHTPLTEDQIRGLKAGDQVRICGTIYTARDAAHAKMVEALAKPGMPVGSLGPTTSGRMDAFAPKLLAQGLKGMMGKGPRSQAVQEAAVRYGAVYFAALGGAGALLAKHVKHREVVAYPELQSEAVARLEVEDFPAIVAMDCQGGDYYKLGPWQYQKEQEGRA